MKRAWIFIGSIILVLFVAGLIMAATGLLTGASLDRVQTLAGPRIDRVLDSLLRYLHSFPFFSPGTSPLPPA